jgi:hypothetical protein
MKTRWQRRRDRLWWSGFDAGIGVAAILFLAQIALILL